VYYGYSSSYSAKREREYQREQGTAVGPFALIRPTAGKRTLSPGSNAFSQEGREGALQRQGRNSCRRLRTRRAVPRQTCHRVGTRRTNGRTSGGGVAAVARFDDTARIQRPLHIEDPTRTRGARSTHAESVRSDTRNGEVYGRVCKTTTRRHGSRSTGRLRTERASRGGGSRTVTIEPYLKRTACVDIAISRQFQPRRTSLIREGR